MKIKSGCKFLEEQQKTYGIFIRFLNDLNLNNIPLIPIRYRKIDVETVFSDGDYDFFLPMEYLNFFLKMMFETFRKNGISFLIKTQKKEKTLIEIYEVLSNKKIVLDIWHKIEMKCSDEKNKRWLDWDFLKEKVNKTNSGYYFILNFEIDLYITHLYIKNKNLEMENVQNRLGYYIKKASEESLLEKIDILKKIKNKKIDITSINDVTVSNIRKQGSIKTTSELKLYINRVINGIQKRNKKNRLVIFLGPDGSGKTTIIENLKCFKIKKFLRFKKTFRKSLIYSIITKKTMKKMGLAKNQVDDINADFIFKISLFRFKIYTILNFYKELLVDRYYYDYLIKDIRFLDKTPTLRIWWEKGVDKIKIPKVIVHLGAKEEIILSRKEEMTKDSINIYQESIFKMYLYKKSYIYIYMDTQNKIEDCLKLIDSILEKSK